jgi:hypothetical protein
MCLVTPFTPPCCRRIHILVSQTPGCPEDWPKSKCPAEFCIQVHQYEPEDRATGICWRCQADNAGEVGLEREKRRPGIDKATIVAGLEELTAAERKNRVELLGYCWYCGHKGGCYGCGSKELPLKEPPTVNISRRSDVCWYCDAYRGCNIGDTTLIIKTEDSPFLASPNKRSLADITSGSHRSGNHTNKRIKFERQDDNNISIPASASIDLFLDYQGASDIRRPYGTDFQLYPTPDPSDFTVGDNFTTPFNGGYGPQDFSPDMLGTGSNNWQAVNQQSGGISNFGNYDHVPAQNSLDQGVGTGEDIFNSQMQQQSANPDLGFTDSAEHHLDPVSEIQPVYINY